MFAKVLTKSILSAAIVAGSMMAAAGSAVAVEDTAEPQHAVHYFLPLFSQSGEVVTFEFWGLNECEATIALFRGEAISAQDAGGVKGKKPKWYGVGSPGCIAANEVVR